MWPAFQKVSASRAGPDSLAGLKVFLSFVPTIHFPGDLPVPRGRGGVYNSLPGVVLIYTVHMVTPVVKSVL